MAHKLKYSLIIVLPILLSLILNAKQYTLLPPLPVIDLICSDEVSYIFKTDQSDRLEYLLDTLNFDLEVFNKRDSLRLSRIIHLDSLGCFKDYETIYKAAFVYLHTGGNYMSVDSIYFKRSAELFNAASKVTEDTLKILGANNMSKLAYNYYLKETEPSKAEPSLFGNISDINFFYNKSNLDSMKIKIKNEFQKKLATMGLPTMSDEEIEKIAEDTVEMIIKQIETARISAKRKAMMYKNEE